MNKNNTIYSVMTSLFVVLISAGAYMKVSIPGNPVPVVLQNMFILLSGLLLGEKWGITCVLTYLLLGFLGLPVFAGNSSGPAAFYGPTAGYLISYIPAVFVIGFISEIGKKYRVIFYSAAVLSAIIITYVFGVTWLKIKLNINFSKAMTLGFYPFIIWDIMKASAAVAIASFIKPVINNVFEE
ncbi:MAG: biotin transporter BioY [Spirochaetes bacterium]|nr:biotin transporter BioY [Spirochaetota bacterium]